MLEAGLIENEGDEKRISRSRLKTKIALIKRRRRLDNLFL